MESENDSDVGDSGGVQGIESDDSLKMQSPSVPQREESNSDSDEPEEGRQVKCFTSLEEFKAAVHRKRVYVTELDLESDLEHGYIGGWVIAHCSSDLSQQGYIEVLVNDHSQTKNVTCYISEPLSKQIPSLTVGYQLFLSRVRIQNVYSEYSQDHLQCVVAEGTKPRLWLVHKDLKEQVVRRLGKKRQKKRPRQKDARKAERLVPHEAVSSGEVVNQGKKRNQAALCPTTSPENNGPSKEHPCLPPRKDNAKMEEKSANACSPSDNNPEKEATQSSGSPQQSSFPDNFDIPDSAFNEYHTQNDESSAEEEGQGSEEEEEEWRPQRVKVGDTGRVYTYTQLADLRPLKDKVYVFGVVKDFRPPTKSRGTDYYLTMTLVDESSTEEGIHCNLFNREKNRLPQIQTIGDIVCLHRVYVNEYGGAPQLVSKKYSSAICFDGRVGTRVVPRTGCVSYTFTQEERERVKQLRKWSQQQERKKPMAMANKPPSDQAVQQASGQPGGQESGKQDGGQASREQDGRQVSREQDGQQMSREQDGQQMSHEQAGGQASREQAEGQASREQAEGQASREQDEQQMSREQSGEQESHGQDGEQMSREQDGEQELNSAKGTKSSINDIKIVSSVSVAITTTLHPDIQFTSIRDVIATEKVPSKFRCRVKVMGIVSPLSVEEMVVLRCNECSFLTPIPRKLELDLTDSYITDQPCRLCTSDITRHHIPLLRCMYFFGMKLEDESGKSLVVYVSGNEAVKFLSGIPPTNFYRKQIQRYALLEALYTLTGENDPFITDDKRHPRPWVDCCLLSYHHPSSKDKVCYHLFDTILCAHDI